MAKRKRQRITETETETPSDSIVIWQEAEIKPAGNDATGKEWEVTIIGPKSKGDIVAIEGRKYVRSKNKRLYDVVALEDSISQWEGIKVYDNHLTDDEFKAKQGMRSVTGEWLGSIVSPFWDGEANSVKGIFKVVKEGLATTLKNAWDQGVLDAIGLSIDTFPIVVKEAQLENESYPIIEGFKKILSVDLVAEPAAGGSFDRILAANQNIDEAGKPEGSIMEKDELKKMIADAIGETLPDVVKSVADALAGSGEEDGEPETPDTTTDKAGDIVEDETLDATPDEAPQEIQDVIQEAKVATCALELERKVNAAGLSHPHRAVIEDLYGGKIFESAVLDTTIKLMKEAQSATDPTGRVLENGRTDISVTIDETDKKQLMLMAKLMGRSAFNALGTNEEDMVKTQVKEAEAYKSWINGGRSSVDFGGRVSELIRTAFLGGNWTMDNARHSEAVSLATVIKNTVNIMTAVDYAGSNRWYESIVDIVETDNPIDTLTLARLFGAGSLDVVAKGAAYTEMSLADEEETPTHVKKGNFIAVNLEDLMADKIDYFRNLPTRLADAWYNTLSDLVGAVFTTNSATGPVLTDTGALFNNTAATSAGGHANLLTTALSWSAYDTVVTAMLSQTAQPLGAGRALADMSDFTILVPTELRAVAYQIRNSMLVPGEDGGATSGGEMQSANNYGPDSGNQPNVVIVPDWTDANDWGVVARYRGASPIKLAFPMGQLTPQIFTADNELAGSMFTNDTIRYKLRMMTYRFSATYDVAPVADWRTLHKSNVA